MFSKKTFVLSIISFLIMGTPNGFAGQCKVNKSADVLNCALKNQADVLRAKAQIPIAKIHKELSERWINPDLEAGLNYTDDDTDKGIDVELAVMQTIENPNIRKARIDKASTNISYAKVLTEEQKDKTAFEVLTILNRLRQISKEKKVLAEAVYTFERVIKTYKNRPALSPEEQISLELFMFSLDDYKIANQQVINEENSYLNMLSNILNQKVKMKQTLFLYSPRVWPKLSANNHLEESLELKKEGLNIDVAKTDYLEAKSSSWPSMRVGPYLQTRPGDMSKIDTYGIKFSFPIPLNSNKKQKEAGKLSVAASEQSYELRKREIESNYKTLKEQYLSGISLLKSYNINNVEKRHKNIEEMFAKGRVSTSLLIEAHRQIVDVVNSYHQYEMKTLQSLWSIYLLERKLITHFKEVSHG